MSGPGQRRAGLFRRFSRSRSGRAAGRLGRIWPRTRRACHRAL